MQKYINVLILFNNKSRYVQAQTHMQYFSIF